MGGNALTLPKFLITIPCLACAVAVPGEKLGFTTPFHHHHCPPPLQYSTHSTPLYPSRAPPIDPPNAPPQLLKLIPHHGLRLLIAEPHFHRPIWSLLHVAPRHSTPQGSLSKATASHCKAIACWCVQKLGPV